MHNTSVSGFFLRCISQNSINDGQVTEWLYKYKQLIKHRTGIYIDVHIFCYVMYDNYVFLFYNCFSLPKKLLFLLVALVEQYIFFAFEKREQRRRGRKYKHKINVFTFSN